ncbi:MAG: helix-turn-helix domain-containing protein [Desulfobacterales bacterium]|nr:helix-turn-helix domain-containing protein [Desulfobacterales bacterium]
MAPESLFGSFFKDMRKARTGLTLRKFCLKHHLDPGYISKLERGLVKPPKSPKVLERFATYLRIEKGSEEWDEFFDRAATSSGTLPESILSDNELVKRLPLVFRTLRGQKVPSEKLDELSELIRRT